MVKLLYFPNYKTINKCIFKHLIRRTIKYPIAGPLK